MKQTVQKMKAGVQGVNKTLLGVCTFIIFALAPMAQAANLLLHYKFDESNGATTVADSSGNGRNGTVNPNTDTSAAFPTAVYGNGLRFHAGAGTANWVRPPNMPNLANFSYCVWVKLDNANDWQAVLHSDAWNSGKVHSVIRSWANNFQTMLPINTCNPTDQYSDNVYSITGNPVGVWHHIAITYDSAGKYCDFYFDGVLRGRRTYTSTVTTTIDAFEIGAQGNNGRPFYGTMDDFRIYDSALSALDVTNILNNVTQLSISGQVKNSGGSGITNATVYYKLSSGSTWSSVTTDSNGNYTLMAWPNSGPYDIYAAKNGYAPSANYAPAPSVGPTDPITGVNITLADATVVSGTVTRYGVAKIGSTVYCYTGAGRTGTLAGTAATDAGGNYTLNLSSNGTYYVSASAAGYTDSTDSTVSAPATGVNLNLTAVPKVQYAFDETTGTTASDASGNGKNGTLTGTSSWLPGLVNYAWANAGAGSVTIPNLASYPEMTITAWVKLNAIPGGSGWDAASLASTDGWNLGDIQAEFIGTGGGTVAGKLQWTLNGIADFYSNAKFDAASGNQNRWIHIGLTYDSILGSIKIYTNGVLDNVATVVTGVYADLNQAFRIGSWNGNSRFLNARLDDFRVFGAALPQSEVQSICNWGVTNANSSYGITASAGANGSISPAGVTQVMKYDSQAYSITPNFAYLVADVLVDDVSVGAVTNYTFTNVQAPHTIAVSFTPAPTYAVSGRVTDGANGVAATVYASLSTNASISPVYVVPTAPNGDFSVNLISGTWYLCASGAGYNPSSDRTVTVVSSPVSGNNFSLIGNGRNIPRQDKLLFSVLTESLPTATPAAPWPIFMPKGAPALTVRGGTPRAVTIGHNLWETNTYAAADGYVFGGTYWDASGPHPIACNGASIVAVVVPSRSSDGGWSSIVDIFYSTLGLSVKNSTGEIQVRRNPAGSMWGTGCFIPEGQKTIISLVVQPNGPFNVYTNGALVYANASTTDVTSLIPGTTQYGGGNGQGAFGTYITVGRNSPDAWSVYNGLVGDVFVYKAALGDSDRIQLENDLRAKFIPPRGSLIRFL